MIDKFIKITAGFVCQTFERNADDKFVCTDQMFIADDQCDYEDTNGNALKDAPECEYQPYEMKAPQNKGRNVKYLLYNETIGSLQSEEHIDAESLEEALLNVLNSMGYSVIEAKKHSEE